MWIRSENSDAIMPVSIEQCGTCVIVRRNFKYVEADDECSAHYTYDEWQMTADQYEVYQSMEGYQRTQDDALVELAELYAAQDDALVELAEIIEEGV